ncbi:MAG: AAA family ATPase [Bacteroidaceae bacterium]|nr:AAA family ATPase [Bacteroidaceae bacterium]
MEKLIGRERELKELEWAVNSNRCEFITLYGRRRVGKTFLVRTFFNDNYSFHYVGAHRKPKSVQLQNFRESLGRYFHGADIPEITNWHDAFLTLESCLESCDDSRKVLFFDEMPWMDTHGSDFVDELEYFWANWVQNRDDIVFVACGSATSWMKEKIEDNQGGLHNRITHRIYLRPFYLSECRDYLESRGFEWDDYQIMQCYMIFGGVPYYLSLLRPNLSLPENVDNLIFRRGGDLSDEFNELYNALFNKADRYISIVRFLAGKREGFNRSEIEQATGFSGGGLTRMLDNLERCDFIVSYSQFNNKSKLTLYRMCDFYTIFYYKFINGNKSKDDHYWLHHYMDRSVESWQGFTFEQLCLRHLDHIKHALGISGVATESSAWRHVAKRGEDIRGAQIDLVIKRADRMIHLVEMKFASARYSISKDYAAQLRERRMTFMEDEKIAQAPVITFITPYGISNGANSGIVHSEITSEQLFAHI